MSGPRSWEEAEVCTCRFCTDLLLVRDRFRQLNAFRYVHDLRMFDRGFGVADLQKLFVAPAALVIGFETVEAAGEYVLNKQSHCDALVSSWPLKQDGHRDFTWERKVLG